MILQCMSGCVISFALSGIDYMCSVLGLEVIGHARTSS